MNASENILTPTTLPDPVQKTLTDFESRLGASLRLVRTAGPAVAGDENQEVAPASDVEEVLWESEGFEPVGAVRETLPPRDGRSLALDVADTGDLPVAALAEVLAGVLERSLDASREVRFFTYELSERYEEINLLYSISETLGSILALDDAARVILHEVCDVMGARRGSLWVHEPDSEILRLTASVGLEGVEGPLLVSDPDAVTAMVFREGRSVIASRVIETGERGERGEGESFLSVPIRYTPPAGESRTVGVINLIGRREGERFNAADQKLLSAIASQVGSALENNRLIQESLSKERMAREMELASDLQQKLMPPADRFEAAHAAARVVPAEQVGGDFYQLFGLSEGRVGVMVGDVSQHGFPSALIMTLSMSAAGIYAREHASPARVLREMDDALREELENTEMFLTAFYCVIDPANGTLTYSNAGHPHAFIVHADGEMSRLPATDPPVGFAGPDAYAEEQMPWKPEEDLLLLFTDGLSDTLSHGTRNDGEGRVLESVRQNLTKPVEEIVEELFSLTSSSAPPIQADDRTAVVLRT